MGTYTTNYNLFLPTIGEQGWGDLVNGNFTTIDTTMKSLSNRIGTLETETDTFDSRIDTLETKVNNIATEIDGNVNCTSVTASNGFYGKLYVKAKIATSGDKTYATCAAQSVSVSGPKETYTTNTSGTLTVVGYSISNNYPFKIGAGVYVKSASDVSGTNPSISSRTLTINYNGNAGSAPTINIYKNGSEILSAGYTNGEKIATYTVSIGDKFYATVKSNGGSASSSYVKFSIPAATTYYLNEY